MNYLDYLKAEFKPTFTPFMFLVYISIGAISLWQGEKITTVILSLLAGYLIVSALTVIMSFIRYKRKKPPLRTYKKFSDFLKENS
ncbi:hypothetical protein KAH94_05650 [bacterium]|nr:hypothetical protein [bacterium]